MPDLIGRMNRILRRTKIRYTTLILTHTLYCLDHETQSTEVEEEESKNEGKECVCNGEEVGDANIKYCRLLGYSVEQTQAFSVSR